MLLAIGFGECALALRGTRREKAGVADDPLAALVQ
jgi:hypothetical protein